MDRLDFPPSNFEVVEQMTRILASKRFTNAQRISGFLEFVTMRAVKGKKTTEGIVGRKIFGEKFIPKVSPDVRVAAGSLRKLMKAYYEGEGCEDAVVIAFAEPEKDRTIKPEEGAAYTPQFSYNRLHHSFLDIRMGYACLARSTYRDWDTALHFFDGVLKREPTNVAAGLGAVETICAFASHHWLHDDVLEPFEAGKALLDRLESRVVRYWRYWAVKADLHYRFESKQAASDCYVKALAFDKKALESFMPYIEFLADIQSWDRVIVIAERYFKENIEDTNALARYAQTMLLIRRPEEGLAILQLVLLREPTNCMAHQLLAMIRFYEKDLPAVTAHLRALKALCDARSFDLILSFFEENEEQCELKGFVAEFKEQTTNVSSVVIEKP